MSDKKDSQSEPIDDLVGSDDPQAAMAMQGWQQVGQLPAVQKALDFGGNLDQYQAMVNSAIAGDPMAQQALVAHNMNMAMGSLAPTEGIGVQDITPQGTTGAVLLKQGAKELPIGNVTNDIRQAGTQALGKTTLQNAEGQVVPTNTFTEANPVMPGGKIVTPDAALNEFTWKAPQDYGKVIVKDAPQQGYGKVQWKADGGAIESQPSDTSLDIPEVGQLLQSVPAQQQPLLSEPTVKVNSLDTPDVDQFLHEDLQQAKYGTLTEQLKAGLEGAARGFAGPLAPLAERALGARPEDIRGRQESNPITAGLGELGGFAGSLMTGVGEGALVAKGGAQIAKLAGVKGIGEAALKTAGEMGLLQAGDEVSKLIVQDPNQSMQTAITDIGLASAMGGVGGAALHGAQGLWKATVGDKVGQLIEDFKGRLHERLNNPAPAESIANELQTHYEGIKSMADDVYGPQGLKAKDIGTILSDMPINNKMTEQASNIAESITDRVEKMAKKPYSYPQRLQNQLQENLDNYISEIQSPQATSSSIFNATQDLKQNLQSYSKFDKFVKPVDEAYDFVRDAKKMAFELRESLEDPSVWGKAAKRQQSINKAFVDFKPALEDFEKKFTSEVAGERIIDPSKVETYVNQLGSAKAEIKQKMLQNFIDASEKYKKVISDTHSSLGIDNPIPTSSLSAVKGSLSEVTPGAKLADIWIKKGLSELGGKATGAAIGAGAAHAAGMPGILGALLGEHTLGPFMSSVLPAIIKPLLTGESKAGGLKAAAEFGNSVVKGDQLINRATTNLFKSGAEIIPLRSLPKPRDIEKLASQVKSVAGNPDQLLQQDKDTNVDMAHYLPDHATAAANTTMNAINYLNSLRPNATKTNPLDGDVIPSSTANSAYTQALVIAQQPLVILNKIQNGTIKPSDIQHLSSLYPELYKGLQQKLYNQMITSISKGNTVPYKTRIGLSMFLATPLDSTMNPSSIVSAQSSTASGKRAIAEQQPEGKSLKSLDNFSNSYMTPDQTRIQHNQKR